MALTCGEKLIKVLQSYGVDTIFGIPGVHTIELYRGLKNSDIRHITPRHEQGAGFMADGYARSSGKVGVCFCISGPGMTNIATAMGQAYADSIPMLVISGVIRSEAIGKGRGHLHEMKSQSETISGVAEFSHTLLDPNKLEEVLAKAYSVFTSKRPRPAHIEVPTDVMSQLVEEESVKHFKLSEPPRPEAKTVELICNEIIHAQSTIILAGGGCINAAEDLQQFVDLTGAPSCLTIAARGLLPPDHPLLLDGIQTLDPFRNHVEVCDLVIAIGTELGETDYDFFGKGPLKIGGKLVRIDIDEEQLSRNAEPHITMVSDARFVLKAINKKLQENNVSVQQDGEEIAKKLNKTSLEDYLPAAPLFDQLLATITSQLTDAIIVGDSTQPVYHGNFTHRAVQPRRWFNGATGFGTLGYALPAAIGAKLAKPDLPVVVIAGDGGFQFTLNEMISAVESETPIFLIIWNNYSYREIKDYMENADIEPVGVDIKPPDFEALSKAMGCEYTKTSTFEALGKALSRPTGKNSPPMVLECDAKEIS